MLNGHTTPLDSALATWAIDEPLGAQTMAMDESRFNIETGPLAEFITAVVLVAARSLTTILESSTFGARSLVRGYEADFIARMAGIAQSYLMETRTDRGSP